MQMRDKQLESAIDEAFDELKARAKERAEGGFDEYGLQWLTMTKQDLLEYLMEEAVDIINYWAMYRRRFLNEGSNPVTSERARAIQRSKQLPSNASSPVQG